MWDQTNVSHDVIATLTMGRYITCTIFCIPVIAECLSGISSSVMEYNYSLMYFVCTNTHLAVARQIQVYRNALTRFLYIRHF